MVFLSYQHIVVFRPGRRWSVFTSVCVCMCVWSWGSLYSSIQILLYMQYVCLTYIYVAFICALIDVLTSLISSHLKGIVVE